MAKPKRTSGRQAKSSRASKGAVIALIVAAAVVVDPFGFQAFLLLRYAVTLVMLLAAVAITWRTGLAFPKSRTVQVLVPVLLLLLLVSSLAARAPVVAVLGASGRQLGWLAWMLFAVAFVVGLSLFDRSDDLNRDDALILGFSVALLGVGVIGALELVGAPLVDVNQQFGNRLQASFGNPGVLGAFVVMGLPIAISGFAGRRRPVLTGAASAIGAGLLILSGTRGAWIGLLAGAAFVAVALARQQGILTGRRVVVAAVLLLAIVAAFLLTGRMATALSDAEGRFATWRVAAVVVAEHPAVGVGPEGLATAFAEAVDDGYVIEYTRDDTVDRAHNGVLDMATSAGIPGLLIYLALLAGVVFVAWEAVTTGGAGKPITVGAAAGVVAYLVQQQVFFQLAVLDLAFWLVVGLLVAATGLATDRKRMPVVTVGAFLVVAFVAAYAAIGVVADHRDKTALEERDVNHAMALLEGAAALRPSDDVHAVLAATIAADSRDPQTNARAGRLVDRALGIDATNEALILARSALLVDAYDATGAGGALDAAQRDLEELVSRDTTNGEAHLRLGAIAFYKADYDAADAHWTRAQYLMPHRPEPTENLGVLRSQAP